MRGRKAAPCPRQPPAGDPRLEKLLRSRTALFPGTVGVPRCATVRRPFQQPWGSGERGFVRAGLGCPLRRDVPGSFSGWATSRSQGHREWLPSSLPRSERFPVLEARWLLIRGMLWEGAASCLTPHQPWPAAFPFGAPGPGGETGAVALKPRFGSGRRLREESWDGP